MAPTSALFERSVVADFSTAAMYLEPWAIMLKIYDQRDSTLTLFAKPFRSKVWMCIGMSLVLGSLAVWFFNRWSPCQMEQHKHNKGNNLCQLPHAVWFTIGTVLNQGKLTTLRFLVMKNPEKKSVVENRPFFNRKVQETGKWSWICIYYSVQELWSPSSISEQL